MEGEEEGGGKLELHFGDGLMVVGSNERTELDWAGENERLGETQVGITAHYCTYGHDLHGGHCEFKYIFKQTVMGPVC